MKTVDLIGHKIDDVLVWVKQELYGLDQACVYIKLNNNTVVDIPWDFDTEVLELTPNDKAKSLKEHNNAKEIVGYTITDIIIFMDDDMQGFIELSNGYILTEICAAPNGTGLAGLQLFKNVGDFEKRYGKNYKRISTEKRKANKHKA